MPDRINVVDYIGSDTTPSEDGAALAKAVLRKRSANAGWMVLDMSKAPPEDLVSSFVNSFFHVLEEQNVDVRELASWLRWEAKFPSERETLEHLTDLYFKSEGQIKHRVRR